MFDAAEGNVSRAMNFCGFDLDSTQEPWVSVKVPEDFAELYVKNKSKAQTALAPSDQFSTEQGNLGLCVPLAVVKLLSTNLLATTDTKFEPRRLEIAFETMFPGVAQSGFPIGALEMAWEKKGSRLPIPDCDNKRTYRIWFKQHLFDEFLSFCQEFKAYRDRHLKALVVARTDHKGHAQHALSVHMLEENEKDRYVITVEQTFPS